MNDTAATASAAPETFRRVSFELKGGAMAGIAFGAEKASPDIVFLHATGFNARAYRAMLEPLGDRFSVLALDARGHGLTTLPAPIFGYAGWQRHRDDLLALIERNFTRPVTLAGHSMGATVSLLAAGKRPDLINGLALIDPVIMPSIRYAAAMLPGAPLLQRYTFFLAKGAARRRAHFPDKAAALAALNGRGIFKAFTPDMIADYVGDGFSDDPKNGGVKLACAPAYEAATFSAHRHDPFAALRRFRDPLVILRAEHRPTTRDDTVQRIAAMRPDARIATVEGSGHMIPMERPDRVRSAIETAALMARPNAAREDLEE
ncbi:hydrolase, putative [alpha proteobacterium U9-1i]|nr:hydrolase, putative [alpha proteobacterium U9-1i]